MVHQLMRHIQHTITDIAAAADSIQAGAEIGTEVGDRLEIAAGASAGSFSNGHAHGIIARLCITMRGVTGIFERAAIAKIPFVIYASGSAGSIVESISVTVIAGAGISKVSRRSGDLHGYRGAASVAAIVAGFHLHHDASIGPEAMGNIILGSFLHSAVAKIPAIAIGIGGIGQ